MPVPVHSARQTESAMKLLKIQRKERSGILSMTTLTLENVRNGGSSAYSAGVQSKFLQPAIQRSFGHTEGFSGPGFIVSMGPERCGHQVAFEIVQGAGFRTRAGTGRQCR